ncbi:MAG: hypothetical protein EON89_05715 [Brevundimonas sp.]|nr:MAG: hypothetical protein EON89_05715 [Brevundimonas sp.]
MHDDYEAAAELAAAMDREEREGPIRREIERQNELEIAEWEKIEAERLADCHRTMPAETLMMVDTIRAQYNAAIAQTRDAEGRATLVRSREAAVAGIIDGQCQSGGEARFERERQARIDEMREGREMPVFVRRPDGSIGPAN